MNKKKSAIIVLAVILFFLLASVLAYLRFSYPKFRYRFDTVFNGRKEHVSYFIKGEITAKCTIPLPPHTAFAYKISDTACVYYTYRSFDQFLDYYRNKGYDVKDDLVTSKSGNKFRMTLNISAKGEKGSFILIDFVKEPVFQPFAGPDGEGGDIRMQVHSVLSPKLYAGGI